MWKKSRVENEMGLCAYIIYMHIAPFHSQPSKCSNASSHCVCLDSSLHKCAYAKSVFFFLRRRLITSIAFLSRLWWRPVSVPWWKMYSLKLAMWWRSRLCIGGGWVGLLGWWNHRFVVAIFGKATLAFWFFLPRPSPPSQWHPSFSRKCFLLEITLTLFTELIIVVLVSSKNTVAVDMCLDYCIAQQHDVVRRTEITTTNKYDMFGIIISEL